MDESTSCDRRGWFVCNKVGRFLREITQFALLEVFLRVLLLVYIPEDAWGWFELIGIGALDGPAMTGTTEHFQNQLNDDMF